jgi:Ca-activated chloride channel family protein
VIEDGYAITTVEQVFINPHDRDLEAQYSYYRERQLQDL